MEPIVGIICEYDPFHRGHARQFQLIRRQLPGARILCVMSGCFTQRGMPAMFAPDFRARAALNAGADLVLELPCAFALREAEHFALGGVSLLTALGFVTHISFGCENAELAPLEAAARMLEQPNEAFHEALRAALAAGQPFAMAQAGAAAAGLAAEASAAPADVSPASPMLSSDALLSQPNNVLAVSYLRALRRLNSPLIPLPVLREGGYHTETLDAPWPSATAVRQALLAGNTSSAEAACGYSFAKAALHRPDALDTALLYQARSLSKADWQALPDCTEGLENRLYDLARTATSREGLLALLKTRRYPYARLNRLLSHALLNVTAQLLADHPVPAYVRLLGFRDRELLSLLRQSRIPVIAKAADANRADPLWQLDERAYDVWALGARLPAGLLYRQEIVRAGVPPLHPA